jgi:hypothetical protein
MFTILSSHSYIYKFIYSNSLIHLQPYNHINSHVQSIANLRTRQAHQLGCFVYTEGVFAPKLCGQVVDVFLDGQL